MSAEDLAPDLAGAALRRRLSVSLLACVPLLVASIARAEVPLAPPLRLSVVQSPPPAAEGAAT